MCNQGLNSVVCRVGARIFLRKEKRMWAAVKRDFWGALDYALKDEIRFSTKAKKKREISGGAHRKKRY